MSTMMRVCPALGFLTVACLVAMPLASASGSHTYVGPVPVEFAPGHIVPNLSGQATLSVADDLFGASIGFSVCSGDACHAACGSDVLTAGVNWDPEQGLTVSVDGGVQGGDTHVCGDGVISIGTSGTITHS